MVVGSNGVLCFDMFVIVYFGVGLRIKVVVILKFVFVMEDWKLFVFVKVDGKFEKCEIEIGWIDDNFVEVWFGFKEGEEIVVKGEFVFKSEFKKDELKGDE